MGKKHLNEDSFIHGIPPEFFMDYFNGLLTFHEKTTTELQPKKRHFSMGYQVVPLDDQNCPLFCTPKACRGTCGLLGF